MIIHLIEFIAIFTAVSIVQPYFFKGLEILFKKKPVNLADELLLILDESEPIEGYLNEALDNPKQIALNGQIKHLRNAIIEITAEDSQGFQHIKVNVLKQKKQLDNKCLLLEIG